RELKLDPGHIVGVVREAVGLLPIASRDVRVHLHPDDATLIREVLSAPDGDRAWTVIEDPLIDRGGCRVTTEASQINAENQTRLNAVIAAVVGDERHV
ncbi:MAG: FliH/SctL family protein, partial [Woeseia sp.]